MLAISTCGQNRVKWGQGTELGGSGAGSVSVGLSEQGSAISRECLPQSQCHGDARGRVRVYVWNLPAF